MLFKFVQAHRSAFELVGADATILINCNNVFAVFVRTVADSDHF